jgi:hypothetical protein
MGTSGRRDEGIGEGPNGEQATAVSVVMQGSILHKYCGHGDSRINGVVFTETDRCLRCSLLVAGVFGLEWEYTMTP